MLLETEHVTAQPNAEINLAKRQEVVQQGK